MTASDAPPLRRPLLLTGPPNSARGALATALAGRRALCAVVEVDELRALIRTGGADPWLPGAGEAQHRLAAVQACLLASSFIAAGVEVVLVDVVREAIADVYRRSAAEPFVVEIDAAGSSGELVETIEASWSAADATTAG